MCLYIDDDGMQVLSTGLPSAHKKHTCYECDRTIEPGEHYKFWAGVYDGTFEVHKMCGHCWGTILLADSITHCGQNFWWDFVHDLDPGLGVVGNALYDAGHDVSRVDGFRLLRTVAGRKRQWRWPDGRLMDPPMSIREPL